MKKIFVFLFFVLFLFFPKNVFAEGEFITNTSIYYDVNTDGTTEVVHYVTLENARTDLYATTYALKLVGISPKNPQAFADKVPIQTEVVDSEEDSVTIKVHFPDSVVGLGAKREFSVRYTDSSLAKKSGEVWEVSVPKLSEETAYNDYTINLSVPVVFGELAYVTPTPRQKVTAAKKLNLSFAKEDIVKNGVTAAFGKFQVFSFDLTYHLENPINKKASIEVAIPPDTALQRIILQKMTPEPANVHADEEGNWLATYILEPRERVDIKAVGSVQLYAEPREFAHPSPSQLEEYKKESEYWQTTDPQIKALAQELKTPRAIYDYVVKTLTYDYSKVKPNVVRLGAKEALLHPTTAICMEFTDLFIALSRAAGIPAREINGFAYTENPDIQPLSLVADVLHAWPEYWDEKNKLWVQVDPTWGSTTGGIDFFTKLDLRHFTFVVHGKDPQKPYPPGSYKLGPNPQKDVFVTFGSLPEVREGKAMLEVNPQKTKLLSGTPLDIKISNKGSVTLTDQGFEVYFDDQKVLEKKIESLPPYGVEDIPVLVPLNLLAYKMPDNVTVIFADKKITTPTNKAKVIAFNVGIVGVLILLLILLVLRYARASRLKRINKAAAI